MNPLAWISAIAYAIAKGVAEAWFDVVRQRSTALEEVPTLEDRARAERLRAAIVDARRMLDGPPNDYDPHTDRTAPRGQGDIRGH